MGDQVQRALLLREAMEIAHKVCGQLSNELAAAIAEMHNSGMSLQQIADGTGLSIAGVEFLATVGHNPGL